MKSITNKLFLSLFLLCSSVAVLDAQTVADTLLLPELVITERYSDREIRSTAPMQILSRKTISGLHAMQLSDAVKHFSGVTVKDYGGIGGLKTVSVRSLGAHHTALNYNGVAITDVQSGQIDIGRFSLDQVEHITLHIGQHDQIFQPARAFSSASAINITSPTPSFEEGGKINGKATIKAGSFGLFNPSLHQNLKLSDKLLAAFSGEFMSANGAYPYLLKYGSAEGDSTSREKRENSDVKNMRLETAFFFQPSRETTGNLRFYYFQSERGLPGATIFYNTKNYSKQRLWDHTFFVQGHMDHHISPKWVLQANAKYNHGYLRYLDPAYLGEGGKMEDIFTQHESYGSVSALFKAFERLSFAASTDLSLATMHANRTAFATPVRLTFQSALAAKWISNRWLATASLLYTQTDERVKNGDAAADRKKFTPYFSTSFKPFDEIDLRWRAFYKHNFRLPTFNDLYYPVVGTRLLLPEEAQQFNTGITYGTSIGQAMPLLTLTADFYHNRVKDKIIAYPTSNLHQWAMMNVGLVEINGLDLSIEGLVHLSDRIQWIFGATHGYQRAVDKSNSSSSSYNHQLPYTPRHSGSVRSTLEMPWFRAAYTLIWSGERYANGYNSEVSRMPGYADHAVSLAKEWQTSMGRLMLAVELLNLCGKNYEIVRNYPMPGRSFRTTISINF